MMGMDGDVGKRQSAEDVTGTWIYELDVER